MNDKKKKKQGRRSGIRSVTRIQEILVKLNRSVLLIKSVLVCIGTLQSLTILLCFVIQVVLGNFIPETSGAEVMS